MAVFKKNALNQITFTLVDRTDFATIESAVTASDFDSQATKRGFGYNHGGSAATTSFAISKLTSLVRSGILRQTLKATECNYDRVHYTFRGHASCADQHIILDFVDNDDSDVMSMLTLIQSLASDAASAAIQGNSRVLLTQSLASDAASAAAQANSRVLLNQSRISDVQSFLLVMSDVLSDFYSDFQSRVPKAVATNSQLSDLHSDLRSFLVVMSGIQSDILSSVSDLQSDFQSRVPKRVATDSQLSDLHSDLKSYLAGMSDVLSDFYSDFQSRVPKRVATDSQLSDVSSDLRSLITTTGVGLTASAISDIASRVWGEKYHAHSLASSFGSLFSVVATNAAAGASRALLNQSFLSDIRSHVSDLQSDFQSRVPKRVATDSQLSDATSDIKSAIAAITITLSASDISDIASAVAAAATGVTASDISDIASAVKAILASDMSDILSAAVQTNSRVLLNQSFLSDIRSHVSDLQSDFQSRIPKRVATDSQLSDLHSDLKSYLVGLSGTVSDIYSLASDLQSDFQSRVPKAVATNSQVSDLASDLKSYLVGLSGIISDAHSAAAQANSRALLNASSISDIYSMLSDFKSDMGSQISSVQSDLDNVQTRILTVGAAAKLERSAGTIVLGTVTNSGFAPTTTEFETSDITTAATDHYKGRIVIFSSGTLEDQATEITAYSLVGGRGHFTVVALTASPTNLDELVIL